MLHFSQAEKKRGKLGFGGFLWKLEKMWRNNENMEKKLKFDIANDKWTSSEPSSLFVLQKRPERSRCRDNKACLITFPFPLQRGRNYFQKTVQSKAQKNYKIAHLKLNMNRSHYMNWSCILCYIEAFGTYISSGLDRICTATVSRDYVLQWRNRWNHISGHIVFLCSEDLTVFISIRNTKKR